MSDPEYFGKYKTIAFERDDKGILIVRFHSDGGPVVYTKEHHTESVDAFYEIGKDVDNRVVILTGTGDSFINDARWDDPVSGPGDWEKVHREGKRMLRNLLDIEVPVIAAINGPATIHAELAVLSDITLASSDTVFADTPHFPGHTVPGDGVHVVWQELLGSNRGRYFLLTGQQLSASEALALGVVNEVLEPEALLGRARELAEYIIARPPLVTRYTRTAITVRWKRLLDEALGYGLALEGLGVLSLR
ncbi:enoyl-CoA hydratase/isomerase family protein [Nocardia jiangxiensis]|uniref:Enoyl-CoA hydratase/isomerase family protein n=1 Tax=Nocardia jiangxiensis TaxID=282685 RepID=A0ABW6RU50_9NOCA|nr:enoyl-CoA hydratase/isomerase family protein [Nocardia jiangxiensis]